MKKLLVLCLIALCCPKLTLWGQTDNSDYDSKMIALAEEVGVRTKKYNKVRVAVWNFTDTFGKKTELGDYIGRDFSIHFTNIDGLVVLDRDHFEQLLSEQGLWEQGMVDPTSAKRIGMLLAADAIVTGTVDVGLHFLRVRIKVINTETGLQFAAALKNIPIDENIKMILKDTSFEEPVKTTAKKTNKHEQYNNKRTTNSNCESLKTGDYHFKNESEYAYLIDITGSHNFKKTITIEAHQDVSLYDLVEGIYQFRLYKNKVRVVSGPSQTGNFRIKKCESVTYTITPSKKYNLINDYYKEVGSPKRE